MAAYFLGVKTRLVSIVLDDEAGTLGDHERAKWARQFRPDINVDPKTQRASENEVMALLFYPKRDAQSVVNHELKRIRGKA